MKKVMISDEKLKDLLTEYSPGSYPAQAFEELIVLRKLLKDVISIGEHPRIRDEMNRFYEWRLLMSQIKTAMCDGKDMP